MTGAEVAIVAAVVAAGASASAGYSGYQQNKALSEQAKLDAEKFATQAKVEEADRREGVSTFLAQQSASASASGAGGFSTYFSQALSQANLQTSLSESAVRLNNANTDIQRKQYDRAGRASLISGAAGAVKAGASGYDSYSESQKGK